MSTELAVKGRSNAMPSIGSDGSFVAIAWGASTATGLTDVYAAFSRDGGQTFSPPMRVNDAEATLFNGEQPPRVAVRGTTITIVWTTKGANGTRIVQSRSDDGARTFRNSAVVPGGEGAGNRGWENAVSDRNGRVYAVWLDHRELAQQNGAVAAGHHDHAGKGAASTTADQKPDGVAMAQRSKLYLASVRRRHPGTSAHRRRLLLLQDRARHGRRRLRLRGVAPRVSRQRPRHRVPVLARRGQDVQAAAASQ